MFKKLFRYRGRRIRYSSRNLLALYRVLFFMPIFVCLGYFVGYKWLYPLYLSNPPDWKIYIVPALIIVGVSIGAIVLITLLVKASIINSNYFSKVEQRQVLARMIIDNGYYTKKQVKSFQKFIISLQKIVFSFHLKQQVISFKKNLKPLVVFWKQRFMRII